MKLQKSSTTGSTEGFSESRRITVVGKGWRRSRKLIKSGDSHNGADTHCDVPASQASGSRLASALTCLQKPPTICHNIPKKQSPAAALPWIDSEYAMARVGYRSSPPSLVNQSFSRSYGTPSPFRWPMSCIPLRSAIAIGQAAEKQGDEMQP